MGTERLYGRRGNQKCIAPARQSEKETEGGGRETEKSSCPEGRNAESTLYTNSAGLISGLCYPDSHIETNCGNPGGIKTRL